MVQFAWGLLMYERFNSLSMTERINAMYSFHSFHPQGKRSDAGNAESGPLIRGAEKGCYLVTEMGATREIILSGNKSLRRVGRCASWRSSSVL